MTREDKRVKRTEWEGRKGRKQNRDRARGRSAEEGKRRKGNEKG